jgi:hypothetical protein
LFTGAPLEHGTRGFYLCPALWRHGW